MPPLTQWLGRPPITRLISSVALLICLCATTTAQEKSPERGFRSAGSYAFSDIETISSTSGNMMVKVPLAGLPAGRGGLSSALSLIYNSKLYDAYPTTIQYMGGPYAVNRLKKSQAGGWRYGFKYELYEEIRYPGFDENGLPLGECDTFYGYITKLYLLTPDGGKHELSLTGYTDVDAYQNVYRDGSAACTGGTPATGTLSYYTTDGTFLRLDVEHDADGDRWNNPGRFSSRTAVGSPAASHRSESMTETTTTLRSSTAPIMDTQRLTSTTKWVAQLSSNMSQPPTRTQSTCAV